MLNSLQAIVDRYDLLLATLLVQVAIMAMVASLLLRVRRFTRLVIADPPGRKERMEFGIVLGVVVALGAWTRLILGYAGADLTVVGPLLSGLVMGWDAGLWTGLIGGLFPVRHGEWLAPVVGAAVGVGAGLIRRLYRNPGSVRDFSPVPFGNVSHIWRRWHAERAIDSRLLVIAAGTLSEAFRTEIARLSDNGWLFSYGPDDPFAYYVVILACLTSVGVSLKIWNTPRIEAHLRRQEALLAEARFDALRSQINPHFLFNTLNTINSLVRTHPDQARTVIVKLSAILRRMLYHRENVGSFKAELEFVDDYLGIELIRFGPERLRVLKEIEPVSLEAQVPSMLLQPLVENAIKHGISARERGGVITIRATVRHGDTEAEMLELNVQDNGVGMDRETLRDSLRRGIGLTNVRERLRSLYGPSFRLSVESEPGRGTMVTIALPFRRRGAVQTSDADATFHRPIHS